MNLRTAETESTLVVAGRETVAEGVVELVLRRPDAAALPPWEPGAHVDLLLAPGLTRPYSLCGDPRDPTQWRVAVLREEAGRGGSRFVHDRLAPGSTLRVRGPRNNFALAPAARYLFVAGGIGVTPILPMLEQASRTGVPWRLLYGGRTAASMAYTERVQAHGEKVQLRPQDRFGLLDLDAFLGAPSEDTLVYCCGPGPLLDAMATATKAWPAGALHTERFSAVAPTAEQAAAEREFEVILSRSGLSLTIPPGCSILDEVERAGIDVATSCREGTCGSCETDVLEGDPEHRDSLLTPDEQEAGTTMYICVSRARGDRLVLDL